MLEWEVKPEGKKTVFCLLQDLAFSLRISENSVFTFILFSSFWLEMLPFLLFSSSIYDKILSQQNRLLNIVKER